MQNQNWAKSNGFCKRCDSEKHWIICLLLLCRCGNMHLKKCETVRYILSFWTVLLWDGLFCQSDCGQQPLNVTLGVILHTWLFLLDLLIWAFSYHCSLSCLPSVINTVLCSSYPVLNLSTWCFSLKCLNSWENHVSHFHASCFWCWVFKETRGGRPSSRKGFLRAQTPTTSQILNP